MEIILGAFVSLIVQFLKKKMGTDSIGTLFTVVMLSFVVASSYVLLVETTFWPTILQVFITAGAVYAYIIQRFEK